MTIISINQENTFPVETLDIPKAKDELSSRTRFFADIAQVPIRAGEKIKAQYDCALAFTAGVKLGLSTSGSSIFSTITNKLFGKEDVLVQHYTGEGEISISDPEFPGFITEYALEKGETFYLKKGAWLASDEEVKIDTTYETLGNVLWSGKEAAILRCTALKENARLYFSSCGQVQCRRLEAGETLYVDNGHLLGYSSSVNKRLSVASSNPLTAVVSGEGFCFGLTGPGYVFIQSRTKEHFIKSLEELSKTKKA